MKYKNCNRCQKDLPITYFYKNKSSRDGYEGQCKECVRKRRERRYAPKIYEIHDMINDKYYIGQTIKPLTERISHHFTRAKTNTSGKNSGLYKSMRENNLDRSQFPIRTLELLDSKEKLDELEKQYIEKYIEKYGEENVYNNTSGGHSEFTTPYRQKVYQSRARGTKGSVVVYDLLNKKWIGEFNTLQEVSKRLSVSRVIMGSDTDWGVIYHYLYFYGSISNVRFDEIMYQIGERYNMTRSKDGRFFLRTKRDSKGENNPACKYSDDTIRHVKEMLVAGEKMAYISEVTHVPYKYIIEINMKRVRTDIEIDGHEDDECYHRYRS